MIKPFALRFVRTLRTIFMILIVLTSVMAQSQPARADRLLQGTTSQNIELNKRFDPISIPAGDVSHLSLSIFNSNGFQVTDATWSDNLEGVLLAGQHLKLANPVNLVNDCGAGSSVTAIGGGALLPGGTTLQLTGGVVPAISGITPGQCTVTVDVTSTTPGNLINTIPVGDLSATGPTGTIHNTTPASATLHLDAIVAPSLSKVFGKHTVLTGEVTTLTLTITNSDPDHALTGVSLIDNFPTQTNDPTPLPGNIRIAAPLPASPMLPAAGCGGSPTLTQADGTSALAVGATSVRINNGTIAPGATCTILVNVMGDTAGTYTNTIPQGTSGTPDGLQTDQGVTNPTAVHDDLNVQENITKSFSPNKFFKGTSSTLTITLSNPTGADYTGVNLVDVLPTDGLVPSSQYLRFSGTPTTTCGGSPTLLVGNTNNPNDTLNLANATVPSVTGCTITATVVEFVDTSGTPPYTPVYPLPYTNTIPPGGVSGGLTNSKPITGTVTVVDTVTPPTLGKSLGKSTVWAGEVTSLTLTIQNNDPAVTLTGVSLLDNFPASVSLANTTTSLTNCGAGATLTEADGTTALTAGSTSVKLNGGSVAPGTTCRIVVNVVSDTQGTYLNSTGTFSMDQPGNPAAKTATLNVREVRLSKAFNPGSFQAGGISHLTITLYNPSGSPYPITSLSDTLPGSTLTYTGTPTTTCGGAVSLNSPTNTKVTLIGGTIPAASGSPSFPNSSGTCTITVDVTAPSSATTATYNNTIHPSDFVYVGPHSTTIPADITVPVTVYTLGDGVAVAKSFSPTTISVPIVGAPGTQSSRLQIRITAPADSDLTEFHVTDHLPTSPAPVTISNSTPASTTGCDTPAPASGAVVLTANTGDTSVTLTHGRIAAGTTCTINVWVTSTSNTRGAYNNVVEPGDLGDAENRTSSVNATATLTYRDAAAPQDMSITKWFDSDTVNNNGISTMHIRLQNTNSVALVSAALQDDLTTMAPNTVIIAAIPNITNSCGGSVTAPALGTLLSLSNGTIPAQVNNVPGICEITVDVQASGSTASTTNTIFKTDVSATYSGTNVTISPTSDATAPLKIGGLSIAAVKGFNPLLVFGNGLSTLSVKLINNNSAKLNGIKFVDNMPVGMFAANPPNANVGTCGGALTVAPGASTYSFSGGSLNPKSTCTLTLSVSISVNGNLTNRIEAGAAFPLLGVTTREGAQSPDPTEASLTNLPGANLSKLFAPNPIALGGSSLLTITITNTNGIPLSELGLLDNLPAGLKIAASPAPVNHCGGTLTADAGTSLVQLNNDGSLAADSDCTIVVAVTTDTPGNYQNCLDVGTLQDAEGATNKEKTCDTLKVVTDLGNAKTLVDTSESFTNGTDVAIGEIATYQVSTSLAAGVGLSNVVLTDRMQKGLAYVDCLQVLVAGVDRTDEFCSATPSNPPVVSSITDPGDSAANPANNGRQVVFNLGNVANLTGSDSSMIIRYRAVVLDVIENKNGTTLFNTATWTWDGNTIPIEGPHLKVVEPQMSVDKSVTPDTASPGSLLTFTLDVAHTASSAADSFDVAAIDALPPGLAYVSGSASSSGLAPSSSTYDPGTATLKFTWDVFPLGQTSTITFQASFVGPAPVINEADLAWTSISLDPIPGGTPVQLSTTNDHSTERWFNPADSTGLNDYGTQDSVSINSASGERGQGGAGVSARLMPLTGFAPGVITAIPARPVNVYDTSSGITIEIPNLGIRTSIVGVPQSGNTWDVTWLGNDVGYLDGTAFPTWSGNSVLTGHVYLSNGLPGPFVNLHTLKWGDQIILHLADQRYIYQVREDKVVSPDDSSVIKHEVDPWLTLITCKDYNAATDSYDHRVVVRAVLVKVEAEPAPSTNSR